ncbi:MAG: hypothetical protein OEW31_01670 [Thermoleophilia bacterium]|nr:hypothetical protein [Thermoleophilia bacterium]MDH4345022.1 hypothetical protein [Thermoleophilia bacterium]MDH5332258.1 hypothetical protein [Thermoleophilia bacterium]
MRLLRRTPALLVANSLSAAIQGQFMFVAPWIVLARGGSPSDAALVAGLVFVPMLAAAVPAGVVCDRTEPARLMVLSLSIGLGACALYPLCALAGHDWLWLVLLAALVTGTVRLFVEGAVLREVGDTATAPWLLRRQTIRSTLNQAALFASPFTGLLAFRAGGATAVLGLVCAIHVVAIALAAHAGRTPSGRATRSRTSLVAGIASFLANPRLQRLGLAALVWNVFAGAALGIMPAVLREHARLDELEASAAFVVGGVAVVALTLPVVGALQRIVGAPAAFLLAVAVEGVAVLGFADVRLALLAPLLYAVFLLSNSAAAAALSGARALEVDVDHQALLNLALISVSLVGYLVGVAATAGLIGLIGFGAVLALIAAGLGLTAVGFRRPLLA